MMTDTMSNRTDWTSDEKTAKALLCMVALGIGEVLGSPVQGRILDKCSTKIAGLFNIIATTVAYFFLILYGAVYEFSFGLAIAMTFTFGIQDIGTQVIQTAMLGFQFESKTTPFSVRFFLLSLFTFFVLVIEAFIETQTAYLVYFGICYVISIVSWSIFIFCFEVKSTEEMDKIREAYNAEKSAMAVS